MDIEISTTKSDLYNEYNDINIIDGRLSLTISNISAVRQRLSIRLNTYRGEWYANTSTGIPYFQSMLVKGSNEELVNSILKSVIVETEGVLGIESFTSSFSKKTRTYTATFACKALNEEGSVESFLLTI